MPDNVLSLTIALKGKDSTQAALGKARAGVQSISEQLEALKRQAQLALTALVSFGQLRALVRLADEVQGVNARLKLATASAQEFAAAQTLALRVAAQTGAGYEAVAGLYTKLAQAASGIGLSQQDVARTTEATALALKVSGASAAEAASVVRQFGQALGAGALRGDEFNSIMENGGRLAKALADGLGLPVGRLRELAEQGLLTSDVIALALTGQLELLRKESAALPTTVSQAMSVLRDAVGQTVDRLNTATGATAGMAGAIGALARNIDTVLGVAAVAAAGAAAAAMTRAAQAAYASTAALVARIAADRQAAISAQVIAAHEVAKAQAMLASAQAAVAAATGMARLSVVQNTLIPAQQRLAAAQAALNATMAAGTGIARGLSGALAIVGGPLGLILTLLTAGATAWAIWGSRAKSAADESKDAIDRARDAAVRLRKEQQFGTGDLGALREGIAALEQKERDLVNAMDQLDGDLVSPEEGIAGIAPRAREASKELATVRAELAQLRKALTDMQARQTSADGGLTPLGKELLSKGFDKFLEQYRKKLDPLGAALRELREEAKKAGIALDSPQFRQAEALVRKALAQDSRTRLPTASVVAQSDITAMQAALKTQQEVLETALSARLVKEEDYYRARSALQEREFATEREKLSRELAAQQDLIDRLSAFKPKDANQREEVAQKLASAKENAAALRAELDALNGRDIAAKFRLEVDRDKARRDIADAIAAAQDEIARLTGTETTEQRRAAIERGMRDLIARVAGDAQGEAIVRKLIDVRAADAELQALESRWRLALETMRNAEQSINIQQQQGLITTSEAQRRIAEAHAQAGQALDALLPKLEAAAQALGPEAVARVRAWKNELAQVKTVVDPVAEALNTGVTNAFATMLEQVGSGAKAAKDAFLDFGRAVILAIQRIAAQRLAEKLFGSGGTGGIGGLLSGALKIIGFARGGYVTGPGTSTSDSIPARLSAGEYVINAAAVRRVGVSLLDAINGGVVAPRLRSAMMAFAAGGLVPAVQAQTAAPNVNQSVRIVNVVDPQAAYDWLDSPAGERVLLNVIGRNATAVRHLVAG